jgi:hypothetical protein
MNTPPIRLHPEPRTKADPRGARILAKTIYRELRAGGLGEREVIAIATELLGQAAAELRDRS